MNSSERALLSLTPNFPTYTQAREFIKAIKNSLYDVYRSMYTQIWEQAGNPKEIVDWTNPDDWIFQRLNGEEQILALKIWRDSNGVLNPRYVRGCWYLATRHGLINHGSDNLLRISEDGNTFVENPDGEFVAAIDSREGIINLLKNVSENSPGKRSDLLPGYIEFCNTYTTYRGESVYKSSLYDRLVNLIERDLVLRDSIYYGITDKGSKYLETYSDLTLGATITTRKTELYKLSQEINKEERNLLEKFLENMDPIKFEHLIKLLLQEMGYNNVIVTTPTNDKGVDVIADIELGISSIHEVVQVKRRAGSINRTVLDQLRGSLHRFNAMRGTIITTGTFTSGTKQASLEKGGAPITLIDGAKLLDLLMQNGIGITKKSVDFYEFDEDGFWHFEEEPPL